MPESSYWMDWFRRLWGTPPDPGPGREVIALHQLLALLLPRLETQGFLLSPDRYILLYSLLQALPADAPPGRWKFALCALLASDEGQQKAFLNIFEECLQAIGQHSAPTGEKKLDKERVPEAGGSTKPTPDSPKPPASSPPASATPPTSRPLVVELEECTDPPYSWDIVPDQEDISIEADEDFGRTLMHLRRRETAEHLVPDLPASIRATISEGGLPVFRYRNPSRPREYLLLLDRYSLDDHRAAAPVVDDHGRPEAGIVRGARRRAAPRAARRRDARAPAPGHRRCLPRAPARRAARRRRRRARRAARCVHACARARAWQQRA